MRGSIAVVQFLCEQDHGLLTETNKRGRTALYDATRENHVETACFLMNGMTKAQINILDQDEKTALDYAINIRRIMLYHAAQHGYLNIVQFLWEHDPDLLTKTGVLKRTVLHEAAKHGHLNIVRFLCSLVRDLLDKLDQDGCTVLYEAAKHDHLDIVQYLDSLDHTLLAKANYLNSTVLHVAADRGHLAIVQFLCKHHPKLLDQYDIDGCLALHYAACNGHEAIVFYLTREMTEEQINFIDGWNNTALDYAKQERRLKAFILLKTPKNHEQIVGNAYGLFFSRVKMDRSCGKKEGASLSDENLQDTNRDKLKKHIEEYLRWSNRHASGLRMSHLFHGEKGRERASILLSIVTNKDIPYEKVLQAVKKHAEDSGSHQHSLSRYLCDALTSTQFVGNMRKNVFKDIKSEWLESLSTAQNIA